MLVKNELEKLGIKYGTVELGEVELLDELSPEMMSNLKGALEKIGFEMIDDKKNIIVDKISTIIIEMVNFSDGQIKTNLSDYLCEKLNYSYTYLSNLFSEVKGTTIEQFYLTQKIEKIKELLVYDQLNLTEIAWRLQYSSVAYLSSQFKKMTGMTPTRFKQLKSHHRSPI